MIVLNSVLKIRIEKSARDAGFDIADGVLDGWLMFSSSGSKLKLWICVNNQNEILSAFDRDDFESNVSSLVTRVAHEVPAGAKATFKIISFDALSILLSRVFQLSRVLPNAPLLLFQEEVKNVLVSTEVERLVKQRVGQNIFRNCLIEYWEGKCAVTKVSQTDLLVASHIKPWSDASDEDRLNTFNGFLLAANYDSVFDKGYITFSDEGLIKISSQIGSSVLIELGIDKNAKVSNLDSRHLPFLVWHRERVFKV